MHYRFSLDHADCRHALLDLARHLARYGHQLSFEVRPGTPPRDLQSALCLGFERGLFRLHGPSPWAPLDPARLPQTPGAPDITIELSTLADTGWSLIVGATGGIGALPGVLRARSPFSLTLANKGAGTKVRAVPANGDPDSLWRGLEAMCARLATLCHMAGDGHAARRPLPGPALSPEPGGALSFVASTLAQKIPGRLMSARFRMSHWRIGLRQRGAQADTDPAGYAWLPDDGARYYADPLLVEAEGRAFLFMEEYRYADDKGVLALAELGPDAKVLAPPVTLLERARHCSFPQHFEHGGQHYLFMENAQEGVVPLYRARRFPDQWEEVAPLVNEPLHDPVLVAGPDRFWLLGTHGEGGLATDTLVAFCAPTPLGPFVPHPANPLFVDARFARAGGPVFSEGGHLVRFAQDGCLGYGQHLNRTELAFDGAGAPLVVPGQGVARPALSGIGGMHTYARSARFEAIDILTPPVWREG